jgi:hypothetical protein
MDIKAKVKILVQQVVEAYIKEQLKINKEKSITILLGYQSPNPSEVLKAITPLLVHYDVTILLSKEWLPVPEPLTRTTYLLIEDTSQAELMEIVEKTSLLVVPAASYRLLSKLALTMDDEVAVWLAIQYQLLGKPIVIANNYVEPTVYQQIHAPYSVQERLQNYIRQIRTDQVNWIPLSKLNQNVADQFQAFEAKKSLILEKHIEHAQRVGLTEISLPQRSQVTPAAKDLAREYRIQIKQSSKGG